MLYSQEIFLYIVFIISLVSHDNSAGALGDQFKQTNNNQAEKVHIFF